MEVYLKWLYLKGNYYWKDPFLTEPWLWEQGLMFLTFCFLGIFQVDQPLVFRGFWPKKTEEVLPARELDLPWFFRDFPLLVVLIRLVLWRFRPRYPTQILKIPGEDRCERKPMEAWGEKPPILTFGMTACLGVLSSLKFWDFMLYLRHSINCSNDS